MGLGKLNDDMHNKYHPYDGWVGWTIALIEVGLFIYFFLGIRSTLNKSSDKIISFILMLSAFGSLYFLGFPLLLIISKVFHIYISLDCWQVRALQVHLVWNQFDQVGGDVVLDQTVHIEEVGVLGDIIQK